MKVPIEAFWMSPCTVLVERELATTLPASCWFGLSSGIRSTKLVSSRLNAMVCELAMLPEMFSSANACARIPVTAVVRAPKIPITLSHLRLPKADGAAGHRSGTRFASRKPEIFCQYIKYLMRLPGLDDTQEEPPAGKIFRPTSAQAGPAAAGLNVRATPLMQ